MIAIGQKVGSGEATRAVKAGNFQGTKRYFTSATYVRGLQGKCELKDEIKDIHDIRGIANYFRSRFKPSCRKIPNEL